MTLPLAVAVVWGWVFELPFSSGHTPLGCRNVTFLYLCSCDVQDRTNESLGILMTYAS